MYFAFKYTSFMIVAIICISSFYISKHPLKNATSKENPIVFKAYNTCIYLLDKYWGVALLGIFAVYLFTRFYALDLMPAGVHIDEVGYWYDAKSLAKYGTDRVGNRYPWLPIAYGDGHSPLYTYMCVVILKFLPFSTKLMRQVMAISSIPFFFASFGIAYQLFESRRFALLAPILVTITPYTFSASRWGLNAYQMLYACSIALYFLIRGIKYKKTRDYFIAGIFIGLSLITYILAYIMMPLFFVLFFAYLMIVKEFKWKNAIATFIPCVFLGLPTFLEQLVNLNVLKPFYFLGSDYNKLSDYRIGELSPINIFKNLGHIVQLVFGNNQYTYNNLYEFGTLYWSSIPLLITGSIIGFIAIYKSLKNKELNLFVPITLYGFSIYIGFLFDDSDCNPYKANAIYIVFILLIISGVRYMSGYHIDNCVCASHQKSSSTLNENVLRKAFVTGTLAILACNFLLFSEFYYRRMNSTYGCLSLFFSTIPGDIINYEEKMYNPNGDIPVYLELNYENRSYTDWIVALYTDMEPYIFNEYESRRNDAPDDQKDKLVMDHYIFAFPEEFDESKNAIYILGDNWDHISGYLTSIGFSCDETFDRYKILYR